MRVLVVEDNQINMKLTADLLARSGYEVLKAFEAETALKIAREEMPDIVIMDMQLPGMDGLTATTILKTDEKTRHIKIIAVTAFAMKGDMERILNAG